MNLNELQIYKLCVGQFAYKWGNANNVILGEHGMIQPTSHVYLDQINSEGWACFGLFGEDCKDLYVRFPIEYANDYLEEVFDNDGKPAMMEEKLT